MKITKLLSCVALATVATSCSLTKDVTLTPTSGKLARQGVTSIPAKFTWNGSGSGDVTVFMPDGEVCRGKYSTIVQGTNSRSYGQSYSNYNYNDNYGYNANIYGSSSYSGSRRSYRNDQNGRAVVTGDKGRVITMFYQTSASNPTSGHGDGYDNKGNRYSIVY